MCQRVWFLELWLKFWQCFVAPMAFHFMLLIDLARRFLYEAYDCILSCFKSEAARAETHTTNVLAQPPQVDASLGQVSTRETCYVDIPLDTSPDLTPAARPLVAQPLIADLPRVLVNDEDHAP
eukprot:s2161_g3.t1